MSVIGVNSSTAIQMEFGRRDEVVAVPTNEKSPSTGAERYFRRGQIGECMTVVSRQDSRD